MMDMIAGLDGEDPLGQRDRGSDDAELVRVTETTADTNQAGFP
jgi:hypothetical protein